LDFITDPFFTNIKIFRINLLMLKKKKNTDDERIDS